MAVMLPTLAAWSSSGTPPEHPASMHAATRTAVARAVCAMRGLRGPFGRCAPEAELLPGADSRDGRDMPSI